MFDFQFEDEPLHHSVSVDEGDEFRSILNAHFPWKVHAMLNHSKRDGFEHIVSWLVDGRAFKVHNQNKFVKHILPMFFRQTKYKSFQRQLNLWGFKRVTNGEDKGAYSHQYLVEGEVSLCKKITRQQEKPKKSSSMMRAITAMNSGREFNSASPLPFMEELLRGSSSYETDFYSPTNRNMSSCESDVYRTTNPKIFLGNTSPMNFTPFVRSRRSSQTMLRRSSVLMPSIGNIRPSYLDDPRYVSLEGAEDFVLMNHKTSQDLTSWITDTMDGAASQVSDDSSLNCFEGRHFYEVEETIGDKLIEMEIITNSTTSVFR